jgi:type II secretion system protein H
MKRRAGGFTLIELLMVVAIIGVLGSMAIFSLSGAVNQNNPAALARALQFTMMRARQEAVADNKQRRLSCLPTACTYQIATSNGMSNAMTFVAAGDNLTPNNNTLIWNVTPGTDWNVNLAGGVQFSVVKTITFFPDGSSSGGTIYLQSKRVNSGQFKVYAYTGTGLARLVNNW